MATKVNIVPGVFNGKTEKRDKRNRKLVKRIDKQLSRIEKLITQLHQVTQKLQTIRGIYKEEKKAA